MIKDTKGPYCYNSLDKSGPTYAACRMCGLKASCSTELSIRQQQWCMSCGQYGHSSVDCPKGPIESAATI